MNHNSLSLIQGHPIHTVRTQGKA